jgi:hypothetical protein
MFHNVNHVSVWFHKIFTYISIISFILDKMLKGLPISKQNEQWMGHRYVPAPVNSLRSLARPLEIPRPRDDAATAAVCSCLSISNFLFVSISNFQNRSLLFWDALHQQRTHALSWCCNPQYFVLTFVGDQRANASSWELSSIPSIDVDEGPKKLAA